MRIEFIFLLIITLVIFCKNYKNYENYTCRSKCTFEKLNNNKAKCNMSQYCNTNKEDCIIPSNLEKCDINKDAKRLHDSKYDRDIYNRRFSYRFFDNINLFTNRNLDNHCIN